MHIRGSVVCVNVILTDARALDSIHGRKKTHGSWNLVEYRVRRQDSNLAIIAAETPNEKKASLQATLQLLAAAQFPKREGLPG